MSGQFTLSKDVQRETLDWGEFGWISNPPNTGSKEITVMEVTLDTGQGHNFHKHPDQEEVIYVMAGEIEQWFEEESQMLKPGDSVFIPAGVIHASFNDGDASAKLMVVLGPCVGEVGYELVDVADQEPWNSLR